MNKSIRIGGASGFWGDSYRATGQLLQDTTLDFIVYDYLAEITMSIMARARAKSPSAGYATDFIDAVIKPYIKRISTHNTRLISNAGGVNPEKCAEVISELVKDLQLNLNVSCITGDDLMSSAQEIKNMNCKEMFSDIKFPELDKVASMNAYLGAFAISKALDKGADIVITGRCVDSAVTLGACIHAFNWTKSDLDQLAGGSLAGHILECGAQATGGNFTDWELSKDIHNIGYPIAEISNDGIFEISKLPNTGGLVNVGTVSEQMLYEIGDPKKYMLPDVICDFSEVSITEISQNKVRVSGAKGLHPSNTYKVCATYADGYRGGTIMTMYGDDSVKKADYLSESIFKASRNTLQKVGLEDFTETSIELIGAESQYGEFARNQSVREVAIKIAAKHRDAAGIGIFLKECVGLGLATPPGLSGFQGGRARPSPVIRLFSFEIPKSFVNTYIDGQIFEDSQVEQSQQSNKQKVLPDAPPKIKDKLLVPLKLKKLAYARSGDKGNSANIGIICRRPEYLSYVYYSLTERAVMERLSHFISGDSLEEKLKHVSRFLLPGISAINFLITDVLGGGGIASIRNDAQGKGFAQLLLDSPIMVSQWIADEIDGNEDIG